MIDLTTTTRQSLRVEEFAEIVGRSRRAVYYWIKTGKLHVVHMPIGQRIPLAECRRVYACVREDYLSRSCQSADSVQRFANAG